MSNEKSYGMQPAVLSPGLGDSPMEEKKMAYAGDATEADSEHLRDVLDMEKRIQDGTAEREEYEVRDNHDVAVKVLSTYDDPSLPVITFRSLFLGLGFACFGAVLAQLYYFKPQTINVSQSFLLIMLYFIGKGMHLVMPSRGIFRYINPGPFNIKEHTFALIMCSTAAGSAIAIQVISVQDLYYNNKLNGGIAIFTLIGSQLIGYGMAGFLVPICVHPSDALWPSQISIANTLQALHFDGGLSTKRIRFYWIVFGFMFVYEIFPQWIFPLLGAVSIVCLFQHTNPVIRNVFGGGSNNEGMGFFSWSFDWNYIGSDCLYNPLAFQLNKDIGIAITYVGMAAVYYGNAWDGLTYPFMSQALFNSTGGQYPQDQVLTDGRFDEAKYELVGPARFSATNALFLIVDNLSIGAALVHVFLWNWKEVKPLFSQIKFSGLKARFSNGFRYFIFGNPSEDMAIDEQHDEHYLVVKASYRQVPQWWFGLVLAGAFACAQATNYTGDAGMPWWCLLVITIIAFIFTIVYAFLASRLGFTQFVSGGTGLYQMLGSYLIPGQPIANMYCAMYGNNPQVQAIALLSDLKLGQYIKVPPRMTFLAQMLGTVVGAILNYIMMLSIISEQREALLSISGTRLWSGQNAQSYNSGAVAWAMGPKMFSAGETYWLVPAALGIGCLLPLPTWLIWKFVVPASWKKTKDGFKIINTAVISQYSCYMSVGVNTSVIPSMVIGLFSQAFVRKKYPKAFTKYNYLLAGALDGGTQVISFILNFAVFGAAGTAHAFPEWWGNDLKYSTDRCLLPDS